MRSITGFTGGTDAQTKNEVDQKVIANNENQENRRLHASEVNLSGPSTLRESIETSASMRRRRPPAPPMPTFSEGRSDSNGLESSHSLDAIRQSVAARSGTPLRPGSTPENSAVYVFGYYIQPSPTNPENACLVTCITNLSPDLKPLEVDYHTCKKLKLFIEELVHLTASLDDPNSGHIKRKVFDDVNMDKIKSYIGNTANYFMTAKHKLGVDSHINSLKSLFARPSDPEPPLKADEHEGPIHAPPLPPRALSIEAAFQKMAAPATSPIAPYVNAETGEIVPDISPLSSSPIAPPPILHETATPKPLADIEDGFIERPIMPKEILRIELVFDAQTQPDACLVWEYISILEQCPLFGIFFIPESRSPLLASSLESSAQILVPLTECQAFTRAAHGHIPLTHLSSGTIILHWDNLTPLHRSFPKQIAYRAEITESPAQSVSEWTMNVTIVRKSRYTLPMLVSACSSLRVSFTTNAPISFCVEYVPHTGEKQVLDERNESKTEFSLGLNGLDGVINLHWDNMASIVSSRQVSYNIQLEST